MFSRNNLIYCCPRSQMNEYKDRKLKREQLCRTSISRKNGCRKGDSPAGAQHGHNHWTETYKRNKIKEILKEENVQNNYLIRNPNDYDTNSKNISDLCADSSNGGHCYNSCMKISLAFIVMEYIDIQQHR